MSCWAAQHSDTEYDFINFVRMTYNAKHMTGENLKEKQKRPLRRAWVRAK